MGIDCEFRATSVLDVDRVRAIPGVHEIYAPGEGGILGEPARWVITTAVRWVGRGYATNERRPRVAALIEALRECCVDLEYGGDNAVPFVEVTDELIASVRGLDE